MCGCTHTVDVAVWSDEIASKIVMNNKLWSLTIALLASYTTSFSQSGEVKSLTLPFEGNGSIAIAHDGTIYVNEYGIVTQGISGSGSRIFKITTDGEVSAWRNDVQGPVGNVLDSQGNYYFNNGNSHKSSTLSCITKDGSHLQIAELEGFSGDLLLTNDEKSLIVPSYTHPRIMQVTIEGEKSLFLEDDRLKGITGITYGSANQLIASNFTTGAIYAIDADKVITEIATIPTLYPNFVIGYITYLEGFIYATGYGSNKIYRVSMDGVIEEFAGNGVLKSTDGSYEEASFQTPNGIEVDLKNRRLLITQNGNGVKAALRVITLN